MKGTGCLIIGARGLIFGIVAGRLLGVGNDGLLGRIGKVLTSEMKVWSAKGKVSSFNETNITYPESAMMNDIKRRIEDAGCQGSEVGFLIGLMNVFEW